MSFDAKDHVQVLVCSVVARWVCSPTIICSSLLSGFHVHACLAPQTRLRFAELLHQILVPLKTKLDRGHTITRKAVRWYLMYILLCLCYFISTMPYVTTHQM